MVLIPFGAIGLIPCSLTAKYFAAGKGCPIGYILCFLLFQLHAMRRLPIGKFSNRYGIPPKRNGEWI
jgi:hypothetical protein